MRPLAARLPLALLALPALLASGLPSPARAQAAAAAAPPANAATSATAAPVDRVEPKVEHIVVEDKGVRIEELRVRGQTQRILVRSKAGDVAAYEILVPDSSRDLSAGPQPTRGASGQRVWNVFSF